VSGEDATTLRGLIEKHVELTGSARGKSILDNFDAELSNFTRVLPRDYARVMEVQRQAQERGIELDGDEVWTQILEVTRG
jgi:glutamate synthase (NADPH/NADH) large chain